MHMPHDVPSSLEIWFREQWTAVVEPSLALVVVWRRIVHAATSLLRRLLVWHRWLRRRMTVWWPMRMRILVAANRSVTFL